MSGAAQPWSDQALNCGGWGLAGAAGLLGTRREQREHPKRPIATDTAQQFLLRTFRADSTARRWLQRHCLRRSGIGQHRPL